MPIYVGLEGHDGTGKSSTADNVLRLFKGDRIHRTNEMAEKRRALISQKNTGELSLSELSRAADETYRDERKYIESKFSDLPDDDIIILDRTWASHAAEQAVECSSSGEEFEHELENGTIQYPQGVLKPALTFELYIPESTRLERVTSRGEKLERRDLRLQDEPEYRSHLELIRKKLGCIRLSLRERNQKTSGLRAAQILLGHSSIPPLNLKHDWRE